MKVHSFARKLARIATYSLAVIPAVGCEMLRPATPVAVTIIDAEKKTPVPGAEVALLYPTSGDSQSNSHDSKGTTNVSGIVQVQASSNDDGLPQVRINAPGYLPEQKSLPGDALRTIKANSSFWSIASHHDPVTFYLEVYHGPGAVIDLAVPLGYRGMIKVDVRIREDVAYQPGQRIFPGQVTDGAALVEGPAILRTEYKPVYRAHYTDDTPVPDRLQDNDVGFRWLRTEGRTELFVIGTRAELESFRRSTDKTAASDSGDKKSKGSGGGGGGRRGGVGGGAGNIPFQQ